MRGLSVTVLSLLVCLAVAAPAWGATWNREAPPARASTPGLLETLLGLAVKPVDWLKGLVPAGNPEAPATNQVGDVGSGMDPDGLRNKTRRAPRDSFAGEVGSGMDPDGLRSSLGPRVPRDPSRASRRSGRAPDS